MRDYAQVRPRFWTGNTGRLLRDDREAQVLALYLITGPHANMIGLYYLPIAYITADTGIPFEGASKALAKLHEGGFCKYDQTAEVVWVVEMARNQVGERLVEADKRCKSIHREYMSLPQNSFLKEFFDRYSGAFHLTAPRTMGVQAPPEPLRSQEQEQEQEQEQKQEKTPDSIESAKNLIFGEGLRLIVDAGEKENTARSFLGKLRSQYGDQAVADVIREAIKQNASDPKAFLVGHLNGKRKGRGAADVGLADKDYGAGIPRAAGAA